MTLILKSRKPKSLIYHLHKRTPGEVILKFGFEKHGNLRPLNLLVDLSFGLKIGPKVEV